MMSMFRSRWTATIGIVLGLLWLAYSSYRAVSELQIDKDVHRQWCVAKYVQTGINPYRLALDLLEDQYPDYRELQLRGQAPAIYAVPQHVPHALLDPSVGPPEPTYPPPTLLWEAVTIGLVPGDWINPIWTVLNLGLLALLARALMQDLATGEGARVKRLWIVAILLLWAPVQTTIVCAQFGVLVVLLVYLAYRLDRQGRWARAGICWAFALLKPSISLPFMLLPLRSGRWRTIGVTAAIHAISLVVVCWWLRAGPVTLIRQWLGVSSYFGRDMYTMQELLMQLRLARPPLGFIFMFGLLAVAAALVLRRRREHDLTMFLGLWLVATFWTYHSTYDFVPLALVLMYVAFKQLPMPAWPRLAVIAACLCLEVALLEPVLASNSPVARLARWGGRLAMVTLVAGALLRMAFPGRGSAETLPANARPTE
jgi:hypothetical protein